VGLPFIGYDMLTPCMVHADLFEAIGDTVGPVSIGTVRRAKLLCEGCPVLVECREWSLDHEELWGIWGGLTPPDRERIMAARGSTRPPSALCEAS
jgi:WhiB family redox-sensing transcriptional regulator